MLLEEDNHWYDNPEASVFPVKPSVKFVLGQTVESFEIVIPAVGGAVQGIAGIKEIEPNQPRGVFPGAVGGAPPPYPMFVPVIMLQPPADIVTVGRLGATIV